MTIEDRIREALRGEGDLLESDTDSSVELDLSAPRAATRRMVGAWAGLVAFVLVLGVGAGVWFLASGEPAPPPTSAPSDLPRVLPRVVPPWPAFTIEFDFVSERGRFLFLNPDDWRYEVLGDDGAARIVAYPDEGGLVITGVDVDDALDVSLHVSEDLEEVPLVLLTNAMDPTEAWATFAGDAAVTITGPSHPDAAVAAVGEVAGRRMVIEFSAHWVPVLIEDGSLGLPRLRVTAFDLGTPGSPVSPDPLVRDFALKTMPLMDPEQQGLLADGMVTFDELAAAADAMVDCVHEKASPDAQVSYQVDLSGLSHSFNSAIAGVDFAFDYCYNRHVQWVEAVFQYQFSAVMTDQLRQHLEAFVVYPEDIESMRAEDGPAMLVGKTDRWRLEAYRQGPSVCWLLWRWDADGRLIEEPTAEQCLRPRHFQDGLWVGGYGDGGDDGEATEGALWGLVDPEGTHVRLRFEDGHEETLDVLGADLGLPTAFFHYLFDATPHGLVSTVELLSPDGDILATDFPYDAAR